MARRKELPPIPTPSVHEVEFYLEEWQRLENYSLQEAALDKLFFLMVPNNEDISDILLKASTLNDFYSTNIFSIFAVAKHILQLHIDERLRAGDYSLVDDIAHISIGGKERNFYSFATKYCSHHNPLVFPIYDSFVENILVHFSQLDGFAKFKRKELHSYPKFIEVLDSFQKFYGLTQFNKKQLDQYLWQLGKKFYPKKYY